MISKDQLIQWVLEARQRTCDLVADLSDSQLSVPCLATLNPLLWELGHIAWFQEKWILRSGGDRAPLLRDADALYDSAAVSHAGRWDLPLPSRQETLRYLGVVRDHVVERLGELDARPRDFYLPMLAVFHEDMHAEALTSTRHTLGYPVPRLTLPGAGPFRAATVEAGGL